MSFPNVWKFDTRWRIEGFLTATTSFHIGTGEDASGQRRRVPMVPDTDGADSKRARVASVAIDHRGKPYIPGTALKGNLRSWLRSHLPDERELIDAVFGRESDSSDDGTGGKVEFRDAFAAGLSAEYHDAGDPGQPARGRHVPYWDPDRLTGVTASVAIDRRTTTADDKKLFHEEYVPPQAGFQVVITGQDLGARDVALILRALQGFNDASDSVRLGAGGHDGWGRFRWERTALKRLNKSDVASWIVALDGRPSALAAAFADADPAPIETELVSLLPSTSDGSRLELEIVLQFDGPFLVNDPSRAKAEAQRDQEGPDLPADHVPLCDQAGRVVLPARSFRGAFRSRAERIVRTINPAAAETPDGQEPLHLLGPIARLFGAPGWASPLEVSDFVPPDGANPKTPRQEFVAIDRFTGGGAPRLKFNAEYADRPKLQGRLALDLSRFEDSGLDSALGLLALTLRDLVEGDITFGFGSAKGYGSCRVTKLQTLGVAGKSGVDFGELGPNPRGDKAARHVLKDLVVRFRDEVESFRPQGVTHARS